jgi:hypothetical protein
MAKLSAHGRTKIAEARKTVNSDFEGRPLEMRKLLMSDYAVLRRSGDRWTVGGKLRLGVSAKEWIDNKRANGWAVTAF